MVQIQNNTVETLIACCMEKHLTSNFGFITKTAALILSWMSFSLSIISHGPPPRSLDPGPAIGIEPSKALKGFIRPVRAL